MPALSAEFGIGPAEVQWTLTGFLAAMTVGMLPTSWLLDRLGYRQLFLIAIAVLAAAGVAGYFAHSFALVIALRIIQGSAAGVLQPLMMTTVMRLMPANERGRASGVNWMRPNFSAMPAAKAWESSVFAVPGTPSSRTWPPHNRLVSMRSMTSSWPTTTLRTSPRMALVIEPM